MEKTLTAILAIESLLITISVIINTLGYITLNFIQGNWYICIFPVSLMILLFVTSIAHIVNTRFNKTSRLPHPVTGILYSTELFVLMMYGIHLQISGKRSIGAIACMSSNALLLLILTIVLLINLKNTKKSNP